MCERRLAKVLVQGSLLHELEAESLYVQHSFTGGPSFFTIFKLQTTSRVSCILGTKCTISGDDMDADPTVEELDSFSLFLPLPFRLALLIVLGVWLWGLNLHGLRLLKIVHRTVLICYCLSADCNYIGRTTSHTISRTLCADATHPPPLRLPLCDNPFDPSCRLHPAILGGYSW